MENSITDFRGAFRWLSNFGGGGFYTDKGTWCKTVEHGYQAAKSLDPHEQEIVLTMSTPGRAKRAGGPNGVVTLRPDWEEVKDQVMLKMLRWKFAQNPDSAAKLLATDDFTLIEGNTWHDNHWGDCHCGKKAACDAPGKNMLGLLLMVVRAELKGQQ